MLAHYAWVVVGSENDNRCGSPAYSKIASSASVSSIASFPEYDLKPNMRMEDIKNRLSELVGSKGSDLIQIKSRLYDVIRAFWLFDINKDGLIQKTELRRIVRNYCFNLSDDLFDDCEQRSRRAALENRDDPAIQGLPVEEVENILMNRGGDNLTSAYDKDQSKLRDIHGNRLKSKLKHHLNKNRLNVEKFNELWKKFPVNKFNQLLYDQFLEEFGPSGAQPKVKTLPKSSSQQSKPSKSKPEEASFSRVGNVISSAGQSLIRTDQTSPTGGRHGGSEKDENKKTVKSHYTHGSIPSSTDQEDRPTHTFPNDLKNNSFSEVDHKGENQDDDSGTRIEDLSKSHENLDVINSTKSDSLDFGLENKSADTIPLDPNTIISEQKGMNVDSREISSEEDYILEDFQSSSETNSKIEQPKVIRNPDSDNTEKGINGDSRGISTEEDYVLENFQSSSETTSKTEPPKVLRNLDSDNITDIKNNQSYGKFATADSSPHEMKVKIDRHETDDILSLDLLIAQLITDEPIESEDQSSEDSEIPNPDADSDTGREEISVAELFSPDKVHSQIVLLGSNESSAGNTSPVKFLEDIIPFAAYGSLSKLFNASLENEPENGNHTIQSPAFSNLDQMRKYYSGLDASEQMVTESREAQINGTNRKDFNICETSNCSDAAESLSEVPRNDTIIKENGTRHVTSNSSESDMDKILERLREDSASAFEYLENIQFNLKEVYHIIKTDKNVRAVVLNNLILYVPVLICDVLLWMVIVKLVRHIRRQIVRRGVVSSERPDEQQNEFSDHKHKFLVKSRRIGNESDEDYCDSSSEFLHVDHEMKEWYPPS
ncbi:EF-hand calcium-binding domain-containing protein 6 [Trichonephila clavipes]|nr:EF-hand calcium-binding domain-containing protein 6 [Trichonephila clavipes]